MINMTLSLCSADKAGFLIRWGSETLAALLRVVLGKRDVLEAIGTAPNEAMEAAACWEARFRFLRTHSIFSNMRRIMEVGMSKISGSILDASAQFDIVEKLFKKY